MNNDTMYRSWVTACNLIIRQYKEINSLMAERDTLAARINDAERVVMPDGSLAALVVVRNGKMSDEELFNHVKAMGVGACK